MKSVIVSLEGGLGNQLFQYAAGFALASSLGVKLILDVSKFDPSRIDPNETFRSYKLKPFQIDAEVQCISTGQTEPRNRYLRFCKRYLDKIMAPLIGSNLFVESNFSFDKNFMKISHPVWLKGFWQSFKYFDTSEEMIRHQINTSKKLSEESNNAYLKILEFDSICVHIRRGDYVTDSHTSNYHGICTMAYYEKGIYIASEGLKDPHCFIFSDDPDWVEKNFNINLPFTLIRHNGDEKAHEDLWLMAACKNFVIANSSFSWWGAWLGSDSEKIVVAPQKWFANERINTADLIPPEWIRI